MDPPVLTIPTQQAPLEAPGAAPSIASVTIDASAEPIQATSAYVSAQDEAEFYRRASATFQLEQNRQNLGVLGRFFGSNSAASTNIAGAVVGVSLIGLITAALSFIFGAASKK